MVPPAARAPAPLDPRTRPHSRRPGPRPRAAAGAGRGAAHSTRDTLVPARQAPPQAAIHAALRASGGGRQPVSFGFDPTMNIGGCE